MIKIGYERILGASGNEIQVWEIKVEDKFVGNDMIKCKTHKQN